jgi:hypothetical protein
MRETFAKLFGHYRRLRFRSAVRHILDTPPLELRDGLNYTLLSLCNHRDVHAYLLAAKTFAQKLPPRRVVVVADPTLTEDDRAIMRRHIPGIEIVDVTRHRVPGLPVGACWERLIAISHEVERSYVIQLDADTVTLGRIDEVQAAMQANRAFLLASESNVGIVDLETAAAWARPRAQRIQHVQVQAEANFDALRGPQWRYARACAGFSGFPRGSFKLDTLHEISDSISARIGQRWHDWGSEQVTSNLVGASQPGAAILPHPKYCNADQEASSTSFLHFIGYVRFSTSRYETVTRQMIDQLRQPSAPSVLQPGSTG